MYAGCMGSSCFGGYAMNTVPLPSYGYGGCFGSGVYDGIPTIPPGAIPTMPPPSVPDFAPNRPLSSDSTYYTPSAGDLRATVLVKLPADAKLFAEGRQLNLAGAERRFTTPPLPADREALYTFRIEYTRDGEQVTQSKKVSVRAGGSATVEFLDLVAKRIAPGDLIAGDGPRLGTPVVPVSKAAAVPSVVPPPPMSSPLAIR